MRGDRPARVRLAMALFALTPFVAEFLLGTIGIDQWVAGLVLAPLYGGGALLVRETARRRRGGWRAILLLAFAYAVLEEGVVVQTLFNPGYLGLDLLSEAYVPWLGIGIWWSLFVLTLHTVWSMAVPIALAEALAPPEVARRPWLGRVGLTVSAALYLIGALLTGLINHAQHRFIASGAHLCGAVLVALGAVAVACHMREPEPGSTGDVPQPLTLGLLSLAAASAFMTARRFAGGWTVVAIEVALLAAAVVSVRTWSSRPGWTGRHVLALAGGALMTYAWHSFLQAPVAGGKGAFDHVGDAVFALVAVGILMAALARARPAGGGTWPPRG